MDCSLLAVAAAEVAGRAQVEAHLEGAGAAGAGRDPPGAPSSKGARVVAAFRALWRAAAAAAAAVAAAVAGPSVIRGLVLPEAAGAARPQVQARGVAAAAAAAVGVAAAGRRGGCASAGATAAAAAEVALRCRYRRHCRCHRRAPGVGGRDQRAAL